MPSSVTAFAIRRGRASARPDLAADRPFLPDCGTIENSPPCPSCVQSVWLASWVAATDDARENRVPDMADLPKVFDHLDVDARWQAFWEATGVSVADPSSGRPPFSMVLPPPNVTGSLHIGHALNQTLPDIVARWKRMLGYDVLWLPGTDHAGIATQNVVEKQLALEGKTRHDLGREEFEARVWEWGRKATARSPGRCASSAPRCDWTRERFTLDESLSKAVRHVFVTLYREGLIYRDEYIVNWCPRCRTALSDLEVVHQDTSGKLWHIRYPGLDGAPDVHVATTRPETMLGDTAVAVNPTTSATRRSSAARSACPSSIASSRSSPTNSSIRSSARAPSR